MNACQEHPTASRDPVLLRCTECYRERPKKPILDTTCGGRMMWFNKNHPSVVFSDHRRERLEFTGGSRVLDVDPDVIADFTRMPFPDKSFKLVVFDPPHVRSGPNGWMRKKYGSLEKGWEEMLRSGFRECMRVLDDYGVLIFKWNESHYAVSKVLALFDADPLFGHRTMVRNNSIWVTFMRIPKPQGSYYLTQALGSEKIEEI